MFAIDWFFVGAIWTIMYGLVMITLFFKFLFGALTRSEAILMVLSITMFSFGVGIAIGVGAPWL